MLALLLAATIGTSGIRGTWSVLARGDRVHLTIVRDHSDWGQSLRRSDLPVSDAQINAANVNPVAKNCFIIVILIRTDPVSWM